MKLCGLHKDFLFWEGSMRNLIAKRTPCLWATVGILWVVLLNTGYIGPVQAADSRKNEKPNILYIVADDLGWKDVGFHGSDIKTPTLDKLAENGAQFDQFYAQPMCTPSRATLMTGRYPHLYGLQTGVIPSAGKYGLATDEWLLPQLLKEAGYTTAIIGKWHLGHADRKYWPRQRGFDYQYGPLLGEIDYFTHAAHGKRDWFRNNKPVVEKGYVTQLLGQDAVRLINGHDPKKPLFLYLAFTAPHAPYQAPKVYLEKYKSMPDQNRRTYAAMSTCMDDEIKNVLNALGKKKMLDNTLVFFQSDNGGPRSAMFTGEVDMSKSTIPADNGPYRDGKGMLYEGGTRVVALANWLGHIQPGHRTNQVIHMVDIYPTLAKIAGASLGKNKPLDGMEVWSAISTNGPSPREEMVYDIEPFRAAIRIGDWKLVWRTVLPSKVELYNLGEDPSEKTNLADQNPQKVSELKQRIEVLSKKAVPPLIMQEIKGISKRELFGSVALPGDDKKLEMEP